MKVVGENHDMYSDVSDRQNHIVPKDYEMPESYRKIREEEKIRNVK